MMPPKLSPIEYIAQVASHRSRILRVSKKLFGEDSLQTKLIDWHDMEKWIFLPGLILFASHRHPKIARRYYDLMNGVGDFVCSLVFFKDMRTSPEDYRHAKDCEKVIDILDRAQDPIALREFGHNNKDWRQFLNSRQQAIADDIIGRNAWEFEFPSCNLLK